MQDVSNHILEYAQHLGRGVSARALVVYADVIPQDDQLRQVLQGLHFPTVLVTRSKEPRVALEAESVTWVTVPDTPMTRAAQFKSTLLVCVTRGVLRQGDCVVFLGGAEGSGILDMAFVFDVGNLPELFSLEDAANFAGDVTPEVFERILTLASQLAVEGREGRPVGTLFVVGDSERVLAQSRSLVLNPFHGHPESVRNILDLAVEETIKEFAALDGAFVVRDDGVVLAAGTQLLPTAQHPPLPGGLGTRHAAAAGITASTAALAVCVSQSTGTVSVFKAGHLVTSLQRPVSGGRSSSPGQGWLDGHPRPAGLRARRRPGGPRAPRGAPAGRSD